MERRDFLAMSAAAAGTAAAATDKPAILGGDPVRRTAFPSWPVFDQAEERDLLAVLRSAHWNRGKAVDAFEGRYAKTLGAGGCLATSNGTSALLTALNVLGIGAGDEVIVPPYTFVATVNVVLQLHAMPVFVDTDVSTFQIDAKKIEAAITPRTRAIIPVHLGGSAADIDTVLAVAKKRSVPVIEDACQAHLAEWRGRKVGTYGTMGCFSFQASKNLNSGEGGAVVCNDTALLERCYAFHNNSRPRRGSPIDFSYGGNRGLNLRLTDFQAALLLAQMNRLEEQSRRREQNAAHLTKLLGDIPGIKPAAMYEGCTRNAYHLYMFRYDASAFAGLTRAMFLKALRAEGVPASGGYTPLNKEPFLKNTLASRGYKKIYPAKELSDWVARNECPANDRLCNEAVWLTQTMLLGERSDMDQIAAAVEKIRRHAGAIARL
jgi:dTDP-4-amino-4,6-dideoxygalactose transaminase